MEEHEPILALIDKLSFFENFSTEEKIALSKLTKHIYSYKANEFIIRQGDFESALFILIKGKVFINKNERPKSKLATLKPGDTFGEIAFLKKISRSANAIAESDTIVLKIDGKMFDRLSHSIQNKFRGRFMDILIDRLDSMNRQYIRDMQEVGR